MYINKMADMVNVRIARMSLINNFVLAFITSHHSITFNCRLIINFYILCICYTKESVPRYPGVF